MTQLLDRYSDQLQSHRQYESKENEGFFAELFTTYDNIVAGFDQMKKIASETRVAADTLKAKVDEFDNLKKALKEEFADIARKLSEELKSTGATAIEPDEFLKLKKVVESANESLTALSKDKDLQRGLEAQLSSELSALNEAWHKEFKLIKQQLDEINQQQSALQIEVEYKGDKTAFVERMKECFRGSKIREATLNALVEAFPDALAIYRDLDKAKQIVGTLGPTFESYFSDNLQELLTWQVPNRYTIKYHGKQLKNHSLGQRASALILFVLSQRDNDLVIIDQPEDDLDNQTIYEDVIKLICKLKRQTQFIFATHNPNIPVLGDAEQVIACSYGQDVINSKIGSIDSPELQEEIVSIMEGGNEAFQRRKEIYQAWKAGDIGR